MTSLLCVSAGCFLIHWTLARTHSSSAAVIFNFSIISELEYHEPGCEWVTVVTS